MHIAPNQTMKSTPAFMGTKTIENRDTGEKITTQTTDIQDIQCLNLHRATLGRFQRTAEKTFDVPGQTRDNITISPAGDQITLTKDLEDGTTRTRVIDKTPAVAEAFEKMVTLLMRK